MARRNPPGRIGKSSFRGSHPMAPWKEFFELGEGDGWRARIPAGKYIISIRAGSEDEYGSMRAYSIPESIEKDPLDYTAYEIAVVDPSSRAGWSESDPAGALVKIGTWGDGYADKPEHTKDKKLRKYDKFFSEISAAAHMPAAAVAALLKDLGAERKRSLPTAPKKSKSGLIGEPEFEPHQAGGWMATVPAGKYRISIVAGSSFYSSPRSNLSDPNAYKEYEVGVLGKTTGLVNVNEIPQFISVRNLFEQYGDTPVAGYITPDQVAAIIDAARGGSGKQLSKLRLLPKLDAKTAQKVKDVGGKTLWRVSPPVQGGGYESTDTYEYIVSSRGGPGSGWEETYFFGSNPQGDVVDWYELPISSGAPELEEDLLERAGYEIAKANTNRRGPRKPRKKRRR